MKTISMLLVSVACTLIPAPAHAAPEQSPMTVTGNQAGDAYDIRVAYGDLRLANQSDADTLRARVQHAAQRACGSLYGETTASQRWQCHGIVMDAAAPQIAAAIDRASNGHSLAGQTITLRFARR